MSRSEQFPGIIGGTGKTKSEEERYYMNTLKRLGLDKAIMLDWKIDTNFEGKKYGRWVFKVMQTGDICNTLTEAVNIVKRYSTGLSRSRVKNVDQNAKPVTVTKRNPQGVQVWEASKRASGDTMTSLSSEISAEMIAEAERQKKLKNRKSHGRIRHSDEEFENYISKGQSFIFKLLSEY